MSLFIFSSGFPDSGVFLLPRRYADYPPAVTGGAIKTLGLVHICIPRCRPLDLIHLMWISFLASISHGGNLGSSGWELGTKSLYIGIVNFLSTDGWYLNGSSTVLPLMTWNAAACATVIFRRFPISYSWISECVSLKFAYSTFCPSDAPLSCFLPCLFCFIGSVLWCRVLLPWALLFRILLALVFFRQIWLRGRFMPEATLFLKSILYVCNHSDGCKPFWVTAVFLGRETAEYLSRQPFLNHRSPADTCVLCHNFKVS